MYITTIVHITVIIFIFIFASLLFCCNSNCRCRCRCRCFALGRLLWLLLLWYCCCFSEALNCWPQRAYIQASIIACLQQDYKRLLVCTTQTEQKKKKKMKRLQRNEDPSNKCILSYVRLFSCYILNEVTRQRLISSIQ